MILNAQRVVHDAVADAVRRRFGLTEVPSFAVEVPPNRALGDLAVTGDRETVFGELPTPSEELHAGYRSHGSLHEARVPLVAYDPHGGALPAGEYRANVDLVRHLFR